MVGEKIKELIANSSLTISELAERLGISAPTINRLYKKESVDTDILIGLCDIYDVPFSYFFTEKELSIMKVDQAGDLKGVNYDIVGPSRGYKRSAPKYSEEKALSELGAPEPEYYTTPTQAMATELHQLRKMNELQKDFIDSLKSQVAHLENELRTCRQEKGGDGGNKGSRQAG